MRNLICLAALSASLVACTSTSMSTGSIGGTKNPRFVDTGTNCPAGSPWYWCTGYRERGR